MLPLDITTIDTTLTQSTRCQAVLASKKFNPHSQELTALSSGIIFIRKEFERDDLSAGLLFVGTSATFDGRTIANTDNRHSRELTGAVFYSRDRWATPKLSNYADFIEDYDVSAIEEDHLRAAKKFGW